jgi:hypothetical protein
MPTYLTTAQAAAAAGIGYARLLGMLRFGRLLPPPKDGHGCYAWTQRDIARIKTALAAPRRRAVQPAVSVS